MTLKTKVEQLGDNGLYWAASPTELGELIHDAREAHRLQSERDNLQHLLNKYEALEAAAENFYGPSKGHRWLPGEALAQLLEDAGKWKARVAELEALANELGRSGAENARRAGEAEGKAEGLEWRVKELEAELASLKSA